MKLLRILTGIHAGAQMQLTPGVHRIGPDDAADIRLTDWHGPDLMLTVSDTGVASVQAVCASAPETTAEGDAAASGDRAAPETVLLVDFVPMEFEGMILCVGTQGVAWPSDYDLLSTLLAQPKQHAARNRRYLAAALACVCAGMVVIALSLVSAVQISRAAPPPNADDKAKRVTDALAAARIEGLQAHAVGETVIVTGMLPDSANDAAVRQLLKRLGISHVTRQYNDATQVARSIEDALGVPGAHVLYAGAGRFVIQGAVRDVTALNAAIGRIRADLAPNVRAIVTDVSELPDRPDARPPANYSALLATDDIRYAQTPDGVKHIYAVDSAHTPAR